ncbi:PREDICTED: solute carrier family 23 member 2-like [Priapulus caudatus]|uniref:Solute carrier family 23 member 2-like n=1 Tax=Priapulus caudatus TaxID=37621 RepID=A0ABM1E5R5_PRICU|nr:PREDICTED: solute carrier family 23 member 2-like [Priapulus caudatus]
MHDDDDFTSESSLVYRYCDDPPWYLAVVFGLQHLLVTIGGVYLSSLTLSRSLCADDDDIRVRVELFGNMAFVAGIATVAQVVLGIRLPIMMAPATGFVLPIVALTSLGTWECPNNASDILKMETFNHTFENSSVNEDSSVWKTRIRELQGGVMLASITQVVVGASGLFGFLLPRIRPLTVAPTVLFGMVIVWVLCVILTETEALPTDTASPAQYADPAYSEWAHNSKWFHLPYPGQYGTPTVSSVTYAGFVLSTLVSIVNSLACYHAVARVTHVPPPPAHAVNRAIIMEGLSGILGGSITGLPLTTHPPNIGVIGITQNASRSVAVVGGLLLCFCGLFSRFSSILAVQPRPVIGGAILVNACVIFSSAVAYAADVDLRTPRATTVLGVAVMMGSVLPDWSARNSDRLQTGNQQLDSALLAALSCGPLIGATVGFLMDLTVPGSYPS